jgi:hypothetical protein
MTSLTAINRFAVLAFWARLIPEIDNDVKRRSVRVIETCCYLQDVSQAALSLLRADDDVIQSVHRVLQILYLLRLAMELLYGGVTDILHDNLVDAFSRRLYKEIYRMFAKFK